MPENSGEEERLIVLPGEDPHGVRRVVGGGERVRVAVEHAVLHVDRVGGDQRRHAHAVELDELPGGILRCLDFLGIPLQLQRGRQRA